MLNWKLENLVPPTMAGNPTTISQFAARYDRMADALHEAVGELQALANKGVTISLAVDEVREKASQAVDNTRKVATRYEGAATTLHAYQHALSEAIGHVNSARHTISSNNPNAGYWRRKKLELEAKLLFDSGNTELIDDVQEAENWVRQYDTEYASAIATYNAAVEARDHAVNSAIAGLHDAAIRADLNDNFFESVVGLYDAAYDLAQKYLAPLIETLRGVLELLKQIVDVLSFIVTILAIFIPVLAPFAAALALASILLSLAVLMCSVLLFALGKETLGRVLSDCIGLVVSVVTSKLGPLKNIGSSSKLLAGAGKDVVPMLADTARVNVHLAFGMGAKEALKNTGLLIADYGQDVAVDFATSEVQDFAKSSTLTTHDMANGGPPWEKSPSFGMDFSDFTFEGAGENMKDALSKGVTGWAGGFGDSFSAIGNGEIKEFTNVLNITAVPAG
jgi:hypothetical protein